MSKEQYEERRFAAKTQRVIDQANEIVEEYEGQNLTLRQLFYQFVARDLLENTMRNYKKLGDILRNARMAGLVSWDVLEDRTRGLRGWSGGYDGPADAIRQASWTYKEPRWETQPAKVEIWIEKEALSGVLTDPCYENRCDYFATKGYPSISSLKEAADRMKRRYDGDQKTVILYFSDHDPEGLHMPQQVGEALADFGVHEDMLEIRRMGLTMDQIRQYQPPPSTAKSGSSRIDWYHDETGTDQAWELDALKPAVIQDLIRREIEDIRDEESWQESIESERRGKEIMEKISRNMDRILDFLDEDDDEW
jgi:hypothetical protein